MDARIKFAGLCSFLNVDKSNVKMPEPSVILVRANVDGDAQAPQPAAAGAMKQQAAKTDTGAQTAGTSQSATLRGEWTVDTATPMTTMEINASVKISFAPDAGAGGTPPIGTASTQQRLGAAQAPSPPEPPPVAFLAFDTTNVTVDDLSGFLPVPDAPLFRYLPLDGVELAIATDPPGTPKVDATYAALVAKRDRFWPDAIGKFDHDFVPNPRLGMPSEQPKKNKVAVFMRFGSGTITPGKPTSKKWRFPINNDPNQGFYPDANGQFFAREVIYSGIPNDGKLTLVITDMEDGTALSTRVFTLLSGTEMTLFIGNLATSAIANFVADVKARGPVSGDHFKDLNRIAGSGLGTGPIPLVVADSTSNAGGELPGGAEDGYCGPDNGNGGHP